MKIWKQWKFELGLIRREIYFLWTEEKEEAPIRVMKKPPAGLIDFHNIDTGKSVDAGGKDG